MGEQLFEVVFRGDVEPGQSIVAVKEGLAKLFKAEAAKIDQMFSGKPVVIKTQIDEATARHYQSSLKKVGALADIRPVKSADSSSDANNGSESKGAAETQSADTPAETQDNQEPDPLENFNFDFDVAPVGSDVLPKEHKQDIAPAEIDTSHITVSEVGEDVLDAKDKRSYEDREVDTSHLSVDDLPED